MVTNIQHFLDDEGGGEFEDTHSVVDGYCTGFLTNFNGNQVLATARHCTILRGSRSIKNSYAVFGYYLNEEGKFENEFPSDRVYKISESVELGQLANNRAVPEDDYALLKLDRAVSDSVAKPLEMDIDTKPKVDDLVALVGHPSGISQKIDHTLNEPAIISYTGENNTLMRVSTDSNHGDSGAPVINVSTGKVVGILISGKPDYKLENKGDFKCAVSQVTDHVSDTMETALSLTRLNSL